MKIRRIHTVSALMSREHKFSFDVSQHTLDYIPELTMFKIDNTLVPISNVREVLLEEESLVVPSSVVSSLTEETTDPKEELSQTKTSVKRTSKTKVN